MDELTGKFFDEIADDCFVECDELLTKIRRSLLRIDDLKEKEPPDRMLMEEILRSCHTLKGLTAMIGAEEIATLVHSVENYFKYASEKKSPVKANDLDILFSGTNTIATLIEVYRKKGNIPDVRDYIDRINNLIPAESSERILEKSTAQVIAESLDIRRKPKETSKIDNHDGKRVWRFLFIPSKELFEKGINITTVRNRIQGLGNLITSAPIAEKDGSIKFEFTVQTDRNELEFSDWKNEGIEYTLISSSEESNDQTGALDAAKVKSEPAPEKNSEPNPQSFIQSNVIRVELSRLDEILRMIGELVVSRSRIKDNILSITGKEDNPDFRILQETSLLMERQLRDLREGIMRLRLVPIGESFERMRFVVRDLIRESNKKISLEISGHDTQIDKFVVEKIFDPLLHLVRNAVSHGIETGSERIRKGKPEEGNIWLKAFASGDSVIITVEDDGCGIKRNEIISKALKLGLIDNREYYDDSVLLDIMCSPGFSTREDSDLVSGRGMGMDIVNRTIQELGGTLHFESENGAGTKFIIQLPLTLSIVDALIVNISGHTYAVPQPLVTEVIRFSSSEVVRMENNEMVSYRDIVLPLINLEKFFNLKSSHQDNFDALVVGNGSERTGLVVDRITGQREIVVRSLSDPFVNVEGISGATELGEGKIVLILDPGEIVKTALRKKTTKIN